MKKLIRAHINFAGSLLLALATGLALANFEKYPTDFVPARDAVCNLQISVLFWIVSGMFLLAALICLFGRQPKIQLMFILWLTMNLFVYRIGLHYMNAKGGVQGYLGGMGDVFGTTAGTMTSLMILSVWYLIIGSCLALALVWVSDRIEIRRAKSTLKMACARCGGHIRFSLGDLGQMIPCPHCQADITLRRPEQNLKTSCFFCQGHIEFPTHAIGEKIACPHCKMDITLKEPA